MKTLSALLGLMLVFASGCAGVKVSGKPFYKNGSTEDLITYLDNGIGKITKTEARSVIGGRPEIFVTKDSERWLYKHSRTNQSSIGLIVFSKHFNKTYAKELELNFDKNGFLTSYNLKDLYTESNERSDKVDNYTNRLTDGLMVGGITAIAVIAADIIKEWIKDEIEKKKE